MKDSVEFAEARHQEECLKIEEAFTKVRDIAQAYLDTHYPEAPDPNLFADQIIETLENMPH